MIRPVYGHSIQVKTDTFFLFHYKILLNFGLNKCGNDQIFIQKMLTLSLSKINEKKNSKFLSSRTRTHTHICQLISNNQPKSGCGTITQSTHKTADKIIEFC